jgi:o-succinylbenzoate synthase
MRYKFDFSPYQRPFKQPLQTSHGVWTIREGIIIRLTDEMGNLSLGEIAPISWFGSESLADALIFCQHLSGFITEEIIFSIPNELPACQFAFESALASFPPPNPPLEGGGNNLDNLPLPRGGNNLGVRDCHLYCGLLPAGETALKTWETLWNQGYRTFKWKITSNLESELNIFERLIDAMGEKNEPVFFRLDANGGLSYKEACQWLEVCDRVSPLIEFLEQPLPVSQFEEMQKLRDRGTIPIALDESVATLTQIKDCYQRGWRGIFVIKPSLMGSPSQLREFCYNNPIDAVFSSVFETDIGRQAALKLAADIAPHTRRDRALGFGVNHWFNHNEILLLENLWKTK